MKDTTAILDIAYPEVESKIKENLNNYKKFISKFINDRSTQLYANAPYNQIYYRASDDEEFFKATGIDKKVIKNAIKNTYYYPMANFNPGYAKDEGAIALLCMIRYFKLNNMSKELDLALINLSLNGKYYATIWHLSFQKFPPQENIMDYAINNMTTNKFDIVKYGNVIGCIKSVCNTWISTYNSKFKEFHDDDCTYLIQQLRNRLGSFIHNIAELYYQAYENKDYISYDSDDLSEDNFHLADSDSFKLARIVSATMDNINNHGVDQRLCKMASDPNGLVKTDEVKSIIEMAISNNDNIALIKQFITLMVATYFMEYKNGNVTDISFVAYSIKFKPNTKNKYILEKSDLLERILINNSEHFNRRKSRKPTANAYYRAINIYFALLIQESNKYR